MWILPKQLHTSPFVPDTEALISDLDEQSQLCAQSLLARSKPSPARTWSQRWKRDSWTRHLSGRILKPSHGQTFVTAWISSVAATRASHSAQPASDSAPKTHDTSGRLSQPELLQCDQVSAFSRMSKDTFLSGCATCCKTWSDWVTEQRGAWRQRVNAARLTRGSESGSWPTIRASEYKDVGPVGSKSHDHMLGKHYLCAVVTQEEHGQAAPASSSSLGSRQGLWLTPRANEPDSDPNFAARNADRGAHCHGTLSSQAKAQDFPTPRTCDWKSSPNADSNIKRMEVGQATLAEFVHAKHKKGDLWSTPRTGATESSRPNNKGGIPLADQAKREQWATPQAHDAQGPKTPEQIAVMRAKGHGVKNLNEQAQWGTPTARDHKSGRGNEEREYKELTPMVERQQAGKLNPRWVDVLQGNPMGWSCPDCPASVIRNWQRFVSGCIAAQTEPMNSDSSGTPWSAKSQSGRSDFLLAS